MPDRIQFTFSDNPTKVIVVTKAYRGDLAGIAAREPDQASTMGRRR
jgi:hypothetical protein